MSVIFCYNAIETARNIGGNWNWNSIWVSGVPATFATKGERPWKDCISDTVKVTPHPPNPGLKPKGILNTSAIDIIKF